MAGALLLIAAAALARPAPAGAAAALQAPGDRLAAVAGAEAPLLFLDCRRCDISHVRQEIRFVNHITERDRADIHVIVTDQPTGGGGRMYTLDFIGRRSFAGIDQTLSWAASPTATSAEERDGLTEMLKVGLVTYAARTDLASSLRVRYAEPAGGSTAAREDRWRNWSFEVYGGGNGSTESTQSSWNARYGVHANRVTELWKVRLRPYFNHDVRRLTRPDGEEIRRDQRRHGVESYIIRSLGPHIGIGLFGEYNTSTRDNLNHGMSLKPAFEYSLFPYDEATRRQITVTYRVGLEMADYMEETIFEKTQESLLSNSINAAVRYRQPWGSIYSGLTGSTYLHDTSLNRLSLDSSLSFALGRGVALNLGGSYQRINDQLALPRRGASLEDILLERTRLATSYRASASVGLSYTFGSIFANVVNPRF